MTTSKAYIKLCYHMDNLTSSIAAVLVQFRKCRISLLQGDKWQILNIDQLKCLDSNLINNRIPAACPPYGVGDLFDIVYVMYYLR